MAGLDPFAPDALDTRLDALVRNMERRWGLSLVSFVPPEAQERLLAVQRQVAGLVCGQAQADLRAARPTVEFRQPVQLHTTHFTLTRSDPAGPIRAAAFVKPGARLYQLFAIVNDISARASPFQVRLERLAVTHDGLGLVLLGETANARSRQARQALLRALNQSLPQHFNLSRRDWDADPSAFHKLHCTLGTLKRRPAEGYSAFVRGVEDSVFDPLTFGVRDVTLVHHTSRSLAIPSQGAVTFPLGERIHLSEEEFSGALNLAVDSEHTS
jgi:hypothetical protein